VNPAVPLDKRLDLRFFERETQVKGEGEQQNNNDSLLLLFATCDPLGVPAITNMMTSTTSGNNAAHASLQSWLACDWQALLQGNQAAWQQVIEAREASLQARKHLSDRTKVLKKCVKQVEGSNAPGVDNFSKECKATIKAYQEEIDQMTKRCKSAETNWSTLLQSLGDLPDPSQLLQMLQNEQDQLLQNIEQLQQQLKDNKPSSTASSSLSHSEKEELMQLRREIAEYEVEFRSLKNQDITIRKLETKIQELQNNAAQQLQDELAKLQADLLESQRRASSEALDREAVWERKVQSLQLQLDAERAGAQAAHAQLWHTADGVSQREAAWDAQRRILVEDAERWREQAHKLTRERDELAMQVEAIPARGIATPPPSMGDWTAERKAYEAEVSTISIGFLHFRMILYNFRMRYRLLS
jgi:homeobox protein cut-like